MARVFCYVIERINSSGAYVGECGSGVLRFDVSWRFAYKFYDEQSAVAFHVHLNTLYSALAASCKVTEHEEVGAVKHTDGDLGPAVKAAVGVILDAVVETIGVDGHTWSDRPCQTCLAVTSMIGRPFGCYKFQADKKGT